MSQAALEALGDSLAKAKRLIAQTASKKNQSKAPKLYGWHAPEVECISKGKSRNPFEFGVKVGIATTHRGNLIVGARAFPGNPYDGHTLNKQVEQASILMQDLGIQPDTIYNDLGYRSVDRDNAGINIKHRGKFKSLSPQEKVRLKRRQAIDPIIGHLKADHRMQRCHHKGSLGDSLHAVLCAAGNNIRWLPCMIATKGVPFLHAVFLRLRNNTANWSNGSANREKLNVFLLLLGGNRPRHTPRFTARMAN